MNTKSFLKRFFCYRYICYPAYLRLGNGLSGQYGLGAGEDCGKRQVVQISDTIYPRHSDCLQWGVGHCHALWWRLKNVFIIKR